MTDTFSSVDLNGRDEETSMYIALLERQVVGLTLANIRQKATIDANSQSEPEFDVDSAIEEAVRRMKSLEKESSRMGRRHRV